MAREKQDLFVPLLKPTLNTENFKEYRNDLIERLKKVKKIKKEIEINEVELNLESYIKRNFGITINTIVIKKINPPMDFFDLKIEQCSDKIDDEFFSEPLFARSIYKSKEPLRITFGKNIYEFYLYINSANLKNPNNNLHISTFTLTTFSSKNNVYLTNIELITLSKWCVNTFDTENLDLKCLFKDEINNKYKIIYVQYLDDKNVDDTFRSIQFWDNTNNKYKFDDDARDIFYEGSGKINFNNMYYFYSVLTHDHKAGLLRRHFKNIKDVMGYCQSISKAYFDIFYGNISLEVTIKPKKEIFEQIGHDSEEFRIWEILALQKHIVKNANELNLKSFKELDDFFDFRVFTKKLEKGGSWIYYANYLKKVTGIEYYYNIRKKEFEMKEKEREKKLQSLNILVIMSIFISIITIFLSPLYCKFCSLNTFSLYSLH